MPTLAVAYSSHVLQRSLSSLSRRERLLRYLSGGTLVAFGLCFIVHGNAAF